MQDDLATDSRLHIRLLTAVTQACQELADREIGDPYRIEPYGAGLDFDELRLPLQAPRLTALDVELGTVKAAVYGTDPDSDPVLLLATVTAEAEAHLQGFIPISEYDEDTDFSVSLINHYTYDAEGTRLVVLHFNARIAPDGSDIILDLDHAVPASSVDD